MVLLLPLFLVFLGVFLIKNLIKTINKIIINIGIIKMKINNKIVPIIVNGLSINNCGSKLNK